MKISVIIPAHNEENSIAATLEAVMAQDYSDLEIIVIDNGSNDRTTEVAKAFPVKVVHEARKGTMWACERGRREAQGEIIVRIDADCLPEKDWISKAIKYFNDDSTVVAVSGPYDYHDGPPVFRYSSFLTQKYIYIPMHHMLQTFHRGGIMVGGNSFFRADALEKIGGFDTDIVFYGDETDTSRRLATVGRLVYDRNLVMPTSARRFEAEGTLKIAGLYWFHFFKGIFSGPNRSNK